MHRRWWLWVFLLALAPRLAYLQLAQPPHTGEYWELSTSLLRNGTLARWELDGGELRALWTDPDFDPSQRAFYYVRLLETAVCRWTTTLCRSVGVDPLSPDCRLVRSPRPA